jgi:putative membrane protein
MDHKSAAMNVTPQSFASQAAVIGKAEIELGQLALQKSQDADVRAYAQRMVKDHTAADAKLKKIASKDNITLPTALDAEHQAVKQKLAGLQGDAFDREYKQQMEKGHEKAVALFQSASQTQQMPQDLKEFAASTLSTLEDHREQAQELEAKKDGA